MPLLEELAELSKTSCSNEECCPPEGLKNLRQTRIFAYSFYVDKSKRNFWLRVPSWTSHEYGMGGFLDLTGKRANPKINLDLIDGRCWVYPDQEILASPPLKDYWTGEIDLDANNLLKDLEGRQFSQEALENPTWQYDANSTITEFLIAWNERINPICDIGFKPVLSSAHSSSNSTA